jgi:predicted Fe-S protein YdhL (DUF1289 family)
VASIHHLHGWYFTEASSPVKRDSIECANLLAMSPEQQQQSPVPSPCISLCEMAPDTGLCRGCLRTIDEIVQWGSADDDYKRAVWAEIRRREADMEFR